MLSRRIVDSQSPLLNSIRPEQDSLFTALSGVSLIAPIKLLTIPRTAAKADGGSRIRQVLSKVLNWALDVAFDLKPLTIPRTVHTQGHTYAAN